MTKGAQVMETKDHYYLSKNLADSMALGRLNKLLFILGNLIPDINPFSYITSIGSSRFSGHSFTCRKAFMKRALEKRHPDTGLRWYQTGILTHYLADSFTRPHNEAFQYSLKDHVEYEHQLHQTLEKFLRRDLASAISTEKPAPQLSAKQLDVRHAAYMEESHGTLEDCRYILQTVVEACHLTLAAKELTV